MQWQGPQSQVASNSNTHNLPESHQTHRAPNADATQRRMVVDMDAGIMVAGLGTGSGASKETRMLDRITSNENKATRSVPVCLCLLHQ